MKQSIKEELTQHIVDLINDGVLTSENKDDWHFHAFNEDYYIVYHHAAREWLKRHNLDVFEAIEVVREYETDNFGEMTTDVNPEKIVNMLAYIWGEEILGEYWETETIEELKEELTNA